MMRNTVSLSGTELFIELGVFFFVLLLFFGVMPALKRNVEKSKSRIFSCRVFVTSGSAYFKKGGALYRVSLYENFFVIVFFGCQKIKYSDVKKLKYEKEQSVSMEVHNVQIKISGFASDLEKLYQKIHSHT